MGKKQHQSDKIYISHSEWRDYWGGKKRSSGVSYSRLPLNCCCISFLPFREPYCDQNGMIYDLMNIVPYIKKYKTNPCTGGPMTAKELIKLNFCRDESSDTFICPVTKKSFSHNSKVVCVSTTGNVYLYETIEKLNFKFKNYKDLLTDVPFKRSDIIILQDPNNIEKHNYSEFHHFKNRLKVISEEENRLRNDPLYRIGMVNPEFKNTLAEHHKAKIQGKEQQRKTKDGKDEVMSSDEEELHTSTIWSDNRMAASLTSTVASCVTALRGAKLDPEFVRHSKITKKGYASLVTNFGNLNIELFCHLTPKACENFLLLCHRKYYSGTKFHRLIRYFMIQGGDPTGTGSGGESAWGKPFEDEWKLELSHDRRGLLSMANSGPNTNTSQFFITFRPCKHLDKKHTIFGAVVGGLEVLSRMENSETDQEDRPLEDILIQQTQVFVDPFSEYDEEKKKKKEAKLAKVAPPKSVEGPSEGITKQYRKGVGMYIEHLAPPAFHRTTSKASTDTAPPKKLKLSGSKLSDFSQW
ncbi:RING-type E3 ubiquitin-protein ligase PPIL2-like isoform X2 [Zophobas morio]|uniref:RING-type E3 ubiquitin-protein ligase PPIL2-like isoform X2 n=1 Tax=Zophobas morio TaxID=2755281 RepID=UPI003083E40A